MATNRVRHDGRFLEMNIDSFVKADENSGTPVALSSLYGVIQYDAADHVTVIDTSGVYELSVIGKVTAGTNQAVAVGDKLYIDDGTSSMTEGDVIPDDTNGAYLGIALETVSAGSTSTIKVKIGY